MKRQVPGLADAARDSDCELPDGVFLVPLDGAQHRWQSQKRFYLLRLSILEPKPYAGRSIVSRLYCTPRAMWKLGWFLRDFLYNPELLSQDEVDERALRGLIRVVKISRTVVNGVSLLNFEPRQANGKNWRRFCQFHRLRMVGVCEREEPHHRRARILLPASLPLAFFPRGGQLLRRFPH